jgi:hypothetical protein
MQWGHPQKRACHFDDRRKEKPPERNPCSWGIPHRRPLAATQGFCPRHSFGRNDTAVWLGRKRPTSASLKRGMCAGTRALLNKKKNTK